jgi:adenylosuccinate lyase
MPHKKNPIRSERICGLARLVRSFIIPSLENIVLWHERDISHSSAERVILPDSTIALDYMLNLFAEILKGLVINKDRMLKNVEHSLGLFSSSKILVLLTQKGLSRDLAYDIVQSLSMKSWKEGLSFKKLVKEDPTIRRFLDEAEIEEAFDIKLFLRNERVIFQRVFDQERSS